MKPAGALAGHPHRLRRLAELLELPLQQCKPSLGFTLPRRVALFGRDRLILPHVSEIVPQLNNAVGHAGRPDLAPRCQGSGGQPNSTPEYAKTDASITFEFDGDHANAVMARQPCGFRNSPAASGS